MSINRSEEFLYFQNKTKHYQNIRKVKPVVKDQLSKSLRNTIDHSRSKSKKGLEPYLKKLEQNLQNQRMIDRLVNIVNSKRTEIVVNGGYSRYNDVRRSFRQKIPYRQDVARTIQLENVEIVNKLGNVKAIVGTNKQWSQKYQEKVRHRRNLSRFEGKQRSKGSLHISRQKFIPEHYKNYLDIVQPKVDNEATHGFLVVPKHKLISLPKIYKRDKSTTSLQGFNQNNLWVI